MARPLRRLRLRRHRRGRSHRPRARRPTARRGGHPRCPRHGLPRQRSAALAPARPFIADLDALGKPWEHFDYAVAVTSRGCPGNCTYCCTPKLWGRKIRFRSAESTLEEIEWLVRTSGHRFLRIKDDTFTAHPKRLRAICRGIEERRLAFRWTCDTRVDFVSAETLVAMRRAGCTMVSFGIESASPEILRNIKKGTDLAQALRATAAARALGLGVRFYLIVGNRGETPATVRQTLEFIEKARPTQYCYAGLTVFPGAEEFELARRRGLIAADDYFAEAGPAAFTFNLGEKSPGMTRLLGELTRKMGGHERLFAPYTVAEREEVLARRPDIRLAYTDLANSYCEERRFDDAERVLRRAAEATGRATVDLLHHLACVALARGDIAATQQYFQRALDATPHDRHLRSDLDALNKAGPMDPRQRATMAARLLARLRTMPLLLNGQPALPMPLDQSEGHRERRPSAAHVG